jgi:hypothetical protein
MECKMLKSVKRLCLLGYFALGLASAISPACAEEVEIDLRAPIIGPDGKVAKDCDRIDDEKVKEMVKINPALASNASLVCINVDMTIGRLAAAALDRQDKDIKLSDIVARGHLAKQIRDAMEILSPAKGMLKIDRRDLETIREQLPKMALPNSEISQAYEALSPPAKK